MTMGAVCGMMCMGAGKIRVQEENNEHGTQRHDDLRRAQNGHTSIAGDGQVTMGQSVIFKSHAHKVRRLYGGQVVIGFAGAVADAFTLCDKFEEKLTQCGGNLERAAVALAQMWRSDSGMRQLETQMIVADKDTLLVVSGTGEVIDPDEGVVAIGSGGNYALAAARALVQNTDLSAHDIAEKRCTSQQAFACSPTTT